MNLESAHRIHIMGVGGAGMSSLARLLLDAGKEVSGCDLAESESLTSLRDVGVNVVIGHGDHGGSELVVYSPAVSHEHDELVAARARGVTVLSRRTLMAQLSAWRPVIGLTGTHGKTTATSMMVHVMAAAQRSSGRLLGASVRGVGSGGAFGDELVVEVDESFGTFADMTPAALGLLNVEADHLDYYGSLDALELAFRDLVQRTTGPVVVWADDPGARRVAPSAITVGHEATWCVEDVHLTRAGAHWQLRGPSLTMSLATRVTGHHVVADASVVAVLAHELGIDVSHIREGLENFSGVPGRFELVASANDVDLYDDYAHLPGEIVATLRAARDAGYENVLAVFQPHRVTRTQALATQFAHAFDDAAAVIVTDIYTAGEANPEQLTGEIVASALAHPRVQYRATLSDVAKAVKDSLSDYDAVFFLGAGDVARAIDEVVR